MGAQIAKYLMLVHPSLAFSGRSGAGGEVLSFRYPMSVSDIRISLSFLLIVVFLVINLSKGEFQQGYTRFDLGYAFRDLL